MFYELIYEHLHELIDDIYTYNWQLYSLAERIVYYYFHSLRHGAYLANVNSNLEYLGILTQLIFYFRNIY